MSGTSIIAKFSMSLNCKVSFLFIFEDNVSFSTASFIFIFLGA